MTFFTQHYQLRLIILLLVLVSLFTSFRVEAGTGPDQDILYKD